MAWDGINEHRSNPLCSVHMDFVNLLNDKNIKIAEDIATIKNELKDLKNTTFRHVEEGDRDGGFRDRLIVLEQEISALKKMAWIRLMIASLIGGFVANGAPEAVLWIVKAIIK